MDENQYAEKIEPGLAVLSKEFYKRFTTNEIMTRGAALAFVCVFSLVPMLLFAVIALSFIFQDPGEANKHVQGFLTQLLPGASASRAASDVLSQTHLVENARGMTQHIGLPLLIGIASLLWAGISLFTAAADSMNAAWSVTETRSFIKLRIVALGVLFGAGLILIISLGISALPTLFFHGNAGLAASQDDIPLWANFLATLLAIVLDILMFVFIYKILPNSHVSWRAALFSGGIAGLLWEMFKAGFAYYLVHFGNANNKIYGTLGGIFLLLTWMYYSCIVLLAGAEVGKMYHDHREGGAVERKSPSV